MPDITSDIVALLTPEQRQALAEKIWEENKEAIENTVRKALHHELQSDVVNRARKIVAEELISIVRSVLKEKSAQIHEEISLIVTALTSDDIIIEASSEAVNTYFGDLAAYSGDRISKAAQCGVNRALNKGVQAIFEQRARKKRSGS
jgi:hypothetical protein